MALTDFHRAVRTVLASGRLGSPVFVRYLLHRTINGPAAIAQLAQTAAIVREWLAQPIDRVYALGSTASRHVTLTLECRGGATALVTWVGSAGRGAGVDLSILGNHGALYHGAGTAELWDEPAQADAAEPDTALVALIERALRSGQPENVEHQL